MLAKKGHIITDNSELKKNISCLEQNSNISEYNINNLLTYLKLNKDKNWNYDEHNILQYTKKDCEWLENRLLEDALDYRSNDAFVRKELLRSVIIELDYIIKKR
jgi:hypothetical protein